MKQLFTSRDLAVTQAVVAALFFLMIPVFHLLGVSSYKLAGFLHGIGATLTVILSCRVLHLLYPLMRGQDGAAKKLSLALWLTNFLVLLTIVFGNWLYIGYRAPDSTQQYLIYNIPVLHTVVMEFKEFVSLFPLPLGIAAGVLLHRFRSNLHESGVASVVAMLVTLFWICLLIGMVTGWGLSKMRMV